MNLPQYKTEKSVDKISPPFLLRVSNKSHLEAVRAVAASDGRFELPEAYCEGKKQKYEADVCAMICHIGESMSHGHFIEVHKDSEDKWYVSDDLLNKESLLIRDYLTTNNMDHLVDRENPNGWNTLENMLSGDPRYVTPVFVYGDRRFERQQPTCETFSGSPGVTTQEQASLQDHQQAQPFSPSDTQEATTVVDYEVPSPRQEEMTDSLEEETTLELTEQEFLDGIELLTDMLES